MEFLECLRLEIMSVISASLFLISFLFLKKLDEQFSDRSLFPKKYVKLIGWSVIISVQWTLDTNDDDELDRL
ncbi:unnamed protein product [Schistosoma margrebowiei]|uniref:Uncharacterized protein n=1 Tax=Schistosoma margrebowiei TaxID=48269 RepID=A0A183LEE2_9TREM|nr:unnamed protein product [Schistosoma margrebowiei]